MPYPTGSTAPGKHTTRGRRQKPAASPCDADTLRLVMTNPVDPSSRFSPALAALISSASVFVPIAMSLSTTPSPNHPRIFVWYTLLRQPSFKPPDWLFPVAWTGIEASLAVSAYRLLRSRPTVARTRALGLWCANILMIGGWSRLFFGRRNLAQSTVAAAALAATSIAYRSEARKVDKVSARAAVPLVGWVAFATILTASIWALNPRCAPTSRSRCSPDRTDPRDIGRAR